MPFGSFFKKIFKKGACEVAEKYGGEQAGDIVEEGIKHLNLDDNNATGGMEDQLVGGLMQAFSGKQQSGLSSLFSTLGGSLSGFQGQAESKGLDPNLINMVMSMLGGGGGGGAAAGGGESGFNMGSLLKVAQSLTSSGSGSGGFMQLLSGLTGGQGGGGSTGNILQVIMGLVKSFFNMQMGKNKSLQDWGKANPDGSKDDSSLGKYGDNLIKDLIFPGKKDKDVMDEDTDGKSAGDGDIKGWLDNHPEIGKIQKDVFDDIFDTTDDDSKPDDDAPLIPEPKGFQGDCSILDQASILFLNTKILLSLRKNWRFLFSTKTQDKGEFLDRVSYQGPVLIIVRDTDGNVFGSFVSTSLGDTKGGWSGNGDSFVFSTNPKMAVFYSTGKDERFLYGSDTVIGLGGKPDRFGLSLDTNLESGTYNEDVETFDLPGGVTGESFSVDHVEVWGLGPDVNPDDERSNFKIRQSNVQVTGGNVNMNDLLGQIE